MLTALVEKDEANAAKGLKTSYFEKFTQTARDFSPAVSRRISVFTKNMAKRPRNPKIIGNAQEALIAAALPNDDHLV